MGNQIVFAYDNKFSEEFYFRPKSRDKFETDFLTMDGVARSNRELELLFQEAQEYDFLMGKTPQSLPDNWEEEN